MTTKGWTVTIISLIVILSFFKLITSDKSTHYLIQNPNTHER